MADHRAQYHLRVHLLPGPDIEERAQALARFCREHDIEEAVLFAAGEDWNNGLLTEAEIEEWHHALRVCRDALQAQGVVASLNPWYTVLHTDRGRGMPSDRHFTPMVSPTGVQAKAVASFACPNWKEHITHLYGRWAELGFRVVWIEDDFRYHNHAPLDWGGDFSGAMLGRFAAKVGRDVSREEVVSAILQPGTPHPWRALWLQTWQEAHLEAASAIRDAVVAASPATLVGMMTSHPSNHAVEGRDWTRFFQAVANGGKVVHRPNFAGYQDAARTALARSSFVLDYQKEIRPRSLDIEVTPEIENFPMTPYSKSDAVTWAHMALAQVHGAGAQMLDVFSFTVHHLADEPWVGTMLERARPGLDALADLFPPGLASRGVGVLWRPDASLHVRTAAGKSMSELWVPLTPPADLLQTLGLAVQPRPGRVNCLWGQAAWAYSDDELRDILSGRVWLDGEATAILQQRGFGEHLPARHHHWWGREEINYSLEHPETTAAPAHENVWLSVNGFTRVAYHTLAEGAEEWTTLRDATGKRLGAGTAVGASSLGGRVATCPWPLATEAELYTLSFHRQALAQRLIAALAGEGEAPATTVGAAYTFPIDMAGGGMRRLAVFNASFDPQRPLVRVPGARRLAGCRLFTAEGGTGEVTARATRQGDALEVTPDEAIPFCGLAVLALE